MVKYNGDNYYIGFAGSYGRGNENSYPAFVEFKKAPDALIFPKLFNSETNSNWTELTNAAISISLNKFLYGNLVESSVQAQKKLQVGPYQEMKNQNVRSGLSADHIPSFAALRTDIENTLGRSLTPAEASTLRNQSLTLVYETEVHQASSRTYGGRNNKNQIQQDALNLYQAIKKDIDALKPSLLKAGYTEKDINNASTQLLNQYKVPDK